MEAEAVSVETAPRTVVMSNDLWKDLNKGAATRQLRTGKTFTASDLVRDGAALAAAEELGDSDAPSRLIADAVCARLGTDDPERAKEIQEIVRKHLWGPA